MDMYVLFTPEDLTQYFLLLMVHIYHHYVLIHQQVNDLQLPFHSQRVNEIDVHWYIVYQMVHARNNDRINLHLQSTSFHVHYVDVSILVYVVYAVVY